MGGKKSHGNKINCVKKNHVEVNGASKAERVNQIRLFKTAQTK